MNYIKAYENFGVSYYMVFKQKEDGSSATIIDDKYNVVDTISSIYNKFGDFTEDAEEKTKKYKINSHNMIFAGSVEKAIEDIERTKSISDYLTPERTQELLDLFRKK